MSTGVVCTRPPVIGRHSRNRSNVGIENAGFVIEQNREFIRWWEHWARRVRRSRANLKEAHIELGKAEPHRLIWFVPALAACHGVLASFSPVLRFVLNVWR